MKMRILALIGLTLVTALAGCGTERNPLLNPALLTGLIPGRSAPEPELNPTAIAALVQTNMSALKEPLMLILLEDRKAAAVVVPYGRNGAVETWTTQDFTTLAFRRGILTATRGLGVDLMSADTAALSARLRGGGGQAPLTLRTLNSANEIVTLPLTCAVTGGGAETLTLASGATRAARRFDALCTGAGRDIRNTYWTAADGQIVQSRQWVGPDAGYLTQQLLRR